MTGGDGAEESAEVILEDGSTCTMTPDLPPPGRSYHSATGLTLCGGWGTGNENTKTSCSTFTGQWETSHQLGVPRWRSVSWDSPSGIVIIGGTNSEAAQTTETLSLNSSSTTPSFQLPYITLYSPTASQCNNINKNISVRHAASTWVTQSWLLVDGCGMAHTG